MRGLDGEEPSICFGCGGEGKALRAGGVTKRNSSGTVICSFTGTYDDAVNGKRVTWGNGDVVTWACDVANQLTGGDGQGAGS